MEQQGRRDILKKVGLLGAAGALALMKAPQAAQAEDSKGSLAGVWTVRFDSITFPGSSYNYIYASHETGYVASGDVDESFFGQKFSPTYGVYTHAGAKTFRYREKGWIYDSTSNAPIGTFEGVGTFTLDRTGQAISGPGTYNQYDPSGNLIYQEQLTAHGTRLNP